MFRFLINISIIIGILFAAIQIITVFNSGGNSHRIMVQEAQQMAVQPDKSHKPDTANAGKKRNTPTPSPTASALPTATPSPVSPYDLNDDGVITRADYDIFLPLYSQHNPVVDFNQDEIVSIIDYNIFKEAFTSSLFSLSLRH